MAAIKRWTLKAMPAWLGWVWVRMIGALTLAALGWYLQNLPGEQETQTEVVPMQSVVVVKTAINAGSEMRPEHLSVHSMPAGYAPSATVQPRQIERLKGLLARRPLNAGQILTLHDLRAPALETAPGARVALSPAQFEGLGTVTRPLVAALYGSGVQLPQAQLTPIGGQIEISVPASQRDQLARLARGTIMALRCSGPGCIPPAPKLKPIKTRALAKPKVLRISYGFGS